MLTRDFVEGFNQIMDVFNSCETEKQFDNTQEWAFLFVENERKFQKKRHCFIFKKMIDNIYDVYYNIVKDKRYYKKPNDER